jgi:hypothetical protein
LIRDRDGRFTGLFDAVIKDAGIETVPEPITDPERIARLDVCRRDRLGGTLHEYRNAA